MDETPGHAADEPTEEPDSGALPSPAGDRQPQWEPTADPPPTFEHIEPQTPPPRRPLHPTTEAFIDEVIEHLTGANPTEPMLDEAGNIVGIRIMPGRPDNYDTYLDRPRSQLNMTYDDWAKLRRIQTGDPHADQAPRLDGSDRWSEDITLGRILRRLIDEGHVVVLDWANDAHDLTVDGRIDITADEAELIRSIQFPRR